MSPFSLFLRQQVILLNIFANVFVTPIYFALLLGRHRIYHDFYRYVCIRTRSEVPVDFELSTALARERYTVHYSRVR